MERFIYSERERLAEEYEKWVNQPLKDGSKIKDCPFSVISFMCSKGYRKINENEIVISKEEYKRLKNLEKFHIDSALLVEIVDAGRKETAEKFAKELRNFIYLCDDLELDADTYGKISNKMNEIAKQFGVDLGGEH